MIKQLTIRPVSEADTAALLKIYSPYVENTAVSFEYSTPSEAEFRERIRTISRNYPYLVAETDPSLQRSESAGVLLSAAGAYSLRRQHSDAAGTGLQVAGYAYASPFKEREAYRHCAEVSIYIDPRFHRMGLGKALYRELERYLLAQNVFTVYACIAVPDETDEYLTDDSERFHAKMGYRTVGKYDRCGYKFGRWHNMIWMEKEIAEKPEKPEDFIPFSRLTGDPGRC